MFIKLHERQLYVELIVMLPFTLAVHFYFKAEISSQGLTFKVKIVDGYKQWTH